MISLGKLAATKSEFRQGSDVFFNALTMRVNVKSKHIGMIVEILTQNDKPKLLMLPFFDVFRSFARAKRVVLFDYFWYETCSLVQLLLVP